MLYTLHARALLWQSISVLEREALHFSNYCGPGGGALRPQIVKYVSGQIAKAFGLSRAGVYNYMTKETAVAVVGRGR